MTTNDKWGRDPSVQIMRKIFSSMEQQQRGLLQKLQISIHDSRLRRWRELALPRFEKSWAEMSKKGRKIDENRAGVMYARGLATIMRGEGVYVSEDLLSSLEDRE